MQDYTLLEKLDWVYSPPLLVLFLTQQHVSSHFQGPSLITFLMWLKWTLTSLELPFFSLKIIGLIFLVFLTL